MMAMVSQELRVDRGEADDIHLEHLLSQELHGFSMPNVRDFYNRVQHCINRLGIEGMREIGPAALFRWLYKKVKPWNKLEREIRKIKQAPKNDGRYHTFGYLWSAIRSIMMYDREDRNDKVYTDGSGRIPGYDPPDLVERTPRKLRKDPKTQSPNAKANAAQADDKDKSKGKGDGKGIGSEMASSASGAR